MDRPSRSVVHLRRKPWTGLIYKYQATRRRRAMPLLWKGICAQRHDHATGAVPPRPPPTAHHPAGHPPASPDQKPLNGLLPKAQIPSVKFHLLRYNCQNGRRTRPAPSCSNRRRGRRWLLALNEKGIVDGVDDRQRKSLGILQTLKIHHDLDNTPRRSAETGRQPASDPYN